MPDTYSSIETRWRKMARLIADLLIDDDLKKVMTSGDSAKVRYLLVYKYELLDPMYLDVNHFPRIPDDQEIVKAYWEDADVLLPLSGMPSIKESAFWAK